MLKKLIKMGVVMSLFVASFSAFAQNAEKPVYPQYGFCSNWELGFALNLDWDMHQSAFDMNGNGLADTWNRSIAAGLDFSMKKQVSYLWAFRARLHMPVLSLAFTSPDPADRDGYQMAGYWSTTVEMMLSLSNWWAGINPDRSFDWYAWGGFGAGIIGFPGVTRGIDGTRYQINTVDGASFGRVMPAVTFGLGYTHKINENWKWFVEGEFNVNDYHPGAFFTSIPFVGWDFAVNHLDLQIGATVNLGLTEADKNIAAQKSLLTQENLDALNSQISALEQQNANARNNEKKLQNRINELEDQLAKAMANQGGKVNSAAADSLQAIINQIKADQLNYYAMPFSVQYGVDEWQVTDEEMEKVKAVARVMKDNSNIKVKVVGFADYTGSDEYNMKLSERRANEVKRLLTKKYGIAEDRISVDFKGKSAPFGDVQYAINRRVSFYRVID